MNEHFLGFQNYINLKFLEKFNHTFMKKSMNLKKIIQIYRELHGFIMSLEI